VSSSDIGAFINVALGVYVSGTWYLVGVSPTPQGGSATITTPAGFTDVLSGTATFGLFGLI
jgi:hypothetical protein